MIQLARVEHILNNRIFLQGQLVEIPMEPIQQHSNPTPYQAEALLNTAGNPLNMDSNNNNNSLKCPRNS